LIRTFKILRLKKIYLITYGDSNVVHQYPMLQQIVGYSFLESCITPRLAQALYVDLLSVFCWNLAIAKMKHKPPITT